MEHNKTIFQLIVADCGNTADLYIFNRGNNYIVFVRGMKCGLYFYIRSKYPLGEDY